MGWLMMLMLTIEKLPADADEPPSRTFSVSQADAGKLPTGWKAEHTGKGEGSVWKVAPDDSAPSGNGYVLAQMAESPNAYFNICIALEIRQKDLSLQVAFKAVRGTNDQGGGLVWRYRDHDNYYLARMNPLEDNFRVYRVVNGKRTQLQSKDGLKIKAGEWHDIKIEMRGDHIRCFLDGDKMLDVRDNTFAESGQVGLWTKADAQTNFDHLEVRGR